MKIKNEREELLEDTLIQVKSKINKYYEDIGRFGEVTDTQMEDLIADIDELLNEARLNKKKLILNKLEEEDTIQE